MRGNLKCAAILPGNVLSNAYAGCVVLCRMGLYSTGQRRMPVKHFLDTNVLIYAVAKNDPRASKAEALLAGGSIISIQSLNEFVSVARRKLGMPWKQINEFVDLICVLCPNPVPISLDTHKGAVAIAQKYGYSVYDALIVSAALESSCETLYSEDLQDGQIINRQLTIRNPFQ
jgi:predicted nucleic acid-binding protein